MPASVLTRMVEDGFALLAFLLLMMGLIFPFMRAGLRIFETKMESIAGSVRGLCAQQRDDYREQHAAIEAHNTRSMERHEVITQGIERNRAEILAAISRCQMAHGGLPSGDNRGHDGEGKST
jgi:hypothetical protein